MPYGLSSIFHFLIHPPNANEFRDAKLMKLERISTGNRMAKFLHSRRWIGEPNVKKAGLLQRELNWAPIIASIA
jgi:hypothetical protein